MTNIHQVQDDAALAYCIVSSEKRITKRHELGPDGTLVSTPSATIFEGYARRDQARDIRDFAARLEALQPTEAVTYGLPERDSRLVTLARLAECPDAVARGREHFAFRSAPGIMFLDHDAGLGLDDLLRLLFAVAPALAKAPIACRQSASAGIQRVGDGALLKPFTKWHLYVAVADASLIPAAGRSLQDLLWAQDDFEDWSFGHDPDTGAESLGNVRFSWIEVGKAGQALERSLLDVAVHQPERLDFAASPSLGEGLRRLDAGTVLLNPDAPCFDLTELQVPIDTEARAQRRRALAHAAARPASDAARGAWLAEHGPRISAQRGLTVSATEEVLGRALEARELIGDFQLLTQEGEWVTVDEVCREPAKYDGRRFADPLEPDYRNDRRVAWLRVKAGHRPVLYSHAHGCGAEYTLRPNTETLGFGQALPTAPSPTAHPSPIDAGLNAAQLAHLAPLPASEDGLALSFADRAIDYLRWSPGLGWMVSNGPVWSRDDCKQRYDAARRLCRAAAADAETTSEKRRLASAKTVHAVVTLAESDLRLIVPADQWDADPFALNTPAGVVDLHDGALRPHAGHLHTLCTSVGPDMGAQAPTFMKFVDDVFIGDRDLVSFVQRVLGYCLTADRREQILLFWHGSGANGKSTLLDLLQWIMGTYAIKLPGTALMTSRNERHPTEIAQLRGRRLACSSELEEGSFFNEPLLKELTGDATASARFMRGDFFEFNQTQKHVVVGNFKPRLRGGDPAMARRIVLVPFAAHFDASKRDPRMLDKLKAEGPAILAWMIRGALDWQAGGLRIPRAVSTASVDYMAAHDDLQLWRDERCVDVGPEGRAAQAKGGELYADFKAWKEARGEHALSATSWFQRLEAQPGITKRRSNGIWYSPIALRGQVAPIH